MEEGADALQGSELRDRYREAVRERIGGVSELLRRVARGEGGAEKASRDVVESLGRRAASHGFDPVARAAELVVGAEPGAFHPRLAGFVDILTELAEGGTGAGSAPHGWLAHAAAPFPEGTDLAVSELAEGRDLRASWRRATALLGTDEPGLAERVARTLGIGVADLGGASPSAVRLVPPSLMEAGPVLPLRDDGSRLVAAAANPTDLMLVAALERITMRSALLEVCPPGDLQVAVLRGLTDLGAGPERSTAGGGLAAPPSALVADRDPEARAVLRSLLDAQGYAVHEAADGMEALGLIDETPEIVVLVVASDLPLLDGGEVVRRMREAGKEQAILVLAPAGGSSEEAELLEAGADDYLRKPFDPRVFRARLAAVVRRHGGWPSPSRA